ncbi:MAG: hypothetical protein F4W95_15440 [Chloroflexi bacterium]|nr:hypothetical protein [Chloroflexota bacterium]MYD49851.1 hypothetical protein [Chloroflexota bacterium]
MPSISVTISIEGDPEGSIAALRRIAGVQSAPPSTAVVAAPQVASAEPATEPAALAPSGTPAQMPSRYQSMWENGASGTARRQPAPEPPPTPAQWDSHLCNELVSNMTDAARRLVAVLAASGADGVTRESLTAQLGIAVGAIRTTQVSIGHALRRVQRDNGNISLPRPVEFHKAINTYMLNPDFRAAIQGRV